MATHHGFSASRVGEAMTPKVHPSKRVFCRPSRRGICLTRRRCQPLQNAGHSKWAPPPLASAAEATFSKDATIFSDWRRRQPSRAAKAGPSFASLRKLQVHHGVQTREPQTSQWTQLETKSDTKSTPADVSNRSSLVMRSAVKS